MKLFLAVLFLQGLILSMAQAQAPAPGPAGPTNITAILTKAGQYTMFLRLLESTRAADQINTQLNNSKSGGLTVFAPTDNAFSSLKAGLLNSLSDSQKVELVQFHIISSYLSLPEFQTASNPLRTQAGDSTGGYPLNVTTSGNQVNITTGMVNTTVSNSIYTDGQLAVYQVDQVLLPLAFFKSPAPAPAPVAAKPKKGAKAADTSDDDTDTSSDSSGASKLLKFGFNKVVFVASLAASVVYVVL